MSLMQLLAQEGEVATALNYFESGATDLHRALNTCAEPLNRLDDKSLCPGSATLAQLNASLR